MARLLRNLLLFTVRVTLKIRVLGFWALVYGYCAFYTCIVLLKLLWSIIIRPLKTFQWVIRENAPACLNDTSLGTHCYVRIKESGLRFHYVAAGERGKPLMLFLHGFPEFWFSWRHQLREFKSEFRVVAVDMRGYGESDVPAGREHYRLDYLVTDVKDIVEYLGYNRCFLVGHDWGGMIAWLFAIHYPEMAVKYLFTSQTTGIGRKGCRLTSEDMEAYMYVFSQPGALTGPLNYYRNAFRLFKEELQADVTFQVGSEIFRAHQAVLLARVPEFFHLVVDPALNKSGDSSELIYIKAIQPSEFKHFLQVNHAEMAVVLHFIYGAVVDLPEGADVCQVLSVADMYGLEDLKEVGVFVLKRDYCRFFQKNQDNVVAMLMESDQLISSLPAVKWAERVSCLATELQEQCISYIVEHFSGIILSDGFRHLLQVQGMSSKPYLLEKIFLAIESGVTMDNCCSHFITVDTLKRVQPVDAMNQDNVVAMLMESDQLISSLPAVKWAERVSCLATELQEQCISYIVEHFSGIILSDGFRHLLQVQGMSSKPYLLEKIFLAIESGVTMDNCCSHFITVDTLKRVQPVDAMATSKPHVDSVRDRMTMAKAQIIERSSAWEMLRNLQLGYE
ncbi:Epoxide hydrolase 4 [Acipenser ruthenus]|uniref:Epoxide hydrolase 4 n=1 Tax=Acipenser ruthenus TaxID=7906 RepID=A0A662YT11_ACIRT|nr:Epoxide hydrolase 4 [Acipenser ruthenus]